MFVVTNRLRNEYKYCFCFYHFQRRHRNEFVEYEKVCSESRSSVGRFSRAVTQSAFDDMLVEFIVCGGHEFNIVDEKHFKRLLHGKMKIKMLFKFVELLFQPIYVFHVFSTFLTFRCIWWTIPRYVALLVTAKNHKKVWIGKGRAHWTSEKSKICLLNGRLMDTQKKELLRRYASLHRR